MATIDTFPIRRLGWPSESAVEEVVSSFERSAHLLDILSVTAHGLVNPQDPYEPIEGAAKPVLADIGVMSVLIDRVRHEIRKSEDFLVGFERMRGAAPYLRETLSEGAS